MKTVKQIDDWIDWERLDEQRAGYGIHTQQVIEEMFEGERLACQYNGSYQGEVGAVWKLPDGRYIVVTDYFGSCTHCDKFLGIRSDNDFKRAVKTMAHNGHIEDTLVDMLWFLENETDKAEQYPLKSLGPKLLRELERSGTES